MSNNKDFIDFFPTDNSVTTNLKYDLIASKMMTGMQNHQRRIAPSPSVGIVFRVVSVIIKIIVSLLIILWLSVKSKYSADRVNRLKL